MGVLKIYRRMVGDPTDGPPVEQLLLDQSCEPYYGYKLTTASLRNCFFGDTAIIFHRWEAEVTE